MQIHKYAPVTGTAAAKRCGGIWSWEPGGTHRPAHPIPEWVGKASAHGGCGRMKGGFYVKLFRNSREQVTDSRQTMKQELFTISLFTEKVTTCLGLNEREKDSRHLN
ncbi:unnamed protein product [Rangifer tarandus platyrhynchus]|uniref:Uncharacterized protein n=2 Tax=Rangifer tarandus platyrhynchus TaxID=3082113 RepID=A0AC60A6M4_RANTA|nr:unnamed protein product [Rangifer tarandus platyrhynchus]